jgi:Second Messenger Oligonucleotide or Dinucleotide Synthetase domain
MTVLTYLTDRASAAVLSESEKSGIDTSISTLGSRLDAYFTIDGDGLSSHFKFGSFTRGTILPRKMDQTSDIDYMVVFAKHGFSPQTYLDRLKRFVEQRYSTSEIYQSNPTVVLELGHIKFELVPALQIYSDNYSIPDGPTDWQMTNPNDFKKIVEDKNVRELYCIKPAIRLAKIWNAANGYVFNSYLFEKFICEQYYPIETNIKTYLFSIFDKLIANQPTQWRNDKINKAKEIIREVRDLEVHEMPYSAEEAVKKLIPSF